MVPETDSAPGEADAGESEKKMLGFYGGRGGMNDRKGPTGCAEISPPPWKQWPQPLKSPKTAHPKFRQNFLSSSVRKIELRAYLPLSETWVL